MATPETSNLPNKKKIWVPLENNPDVFSHLASKLGVSSNLDFYDVYSIDDPELLAFVPRPVYALLFTCPADVYYKAREKDDKTVPEYNEAGDKEPVVWFKQTIGNACGLIALLHGLCNGETKQYIQPGSDMEKLLKEAIPLKRQARADLLYNSEALEVAHKSAAVRGDTVAPNSEDPVGNHYICFVKGKDGHLWELEGGWKGPLDRGALEPEEDMLSDKALNLGVKNFLAQAGGKDLRFSLVAMAPNLN
ncbi:MAG: hypothetical protein M1834_005014 [Cirrosporium novae-zelandiae]|nr:MAG: hypothetical protein M1834_005014 [Cirrosporium novae-zelandiae]